MQYNSKNLHFAKSMRSKMTEEEAKLWSHLRAKRFYGFKFKRLVLIGDYIVDFLCPKQKLVVEIDGGQHNIDENIIKDKKRTQYLSSCGYKILRFWNNEIRDNFDGVCEVIKRALEE